VKDTDTVALELTGQQLQILAACLRENRYHKNTRLQHVLEWVIDNYRPSMANSVHAIDGELVVNK
jgi:hypothetical protein